MEKEFEIFGKSVLEANKKKCGDSFAFDTVCNHAILAMSDGVGSKPCDWLASQETCEKFMELTKQKCKVGFEGEDFIEIAKIVDRFVSNPIDKCEGMMSAFSGVVWNADDNFIHLLNVGDTRIYKVSLKGKVTQITKDDSKAVIMRKKDGKLLLVKGVTVVRVGLTNAFGLSSVNAVPQTCDFNYGDTVFLASDGFYSCSSSFENDLVKVSNSFNLSTSIQKLFSKYQDKFKDDATLLAIRHNIKDSSTKREFTIEGYEQLKSETPHAELTLVLFEALTKAIKIKDEELSEEIFFFIKTDMLIPSREMLENLLKIMKDTKSKDIYVYRGIVGLIKIIS